MSTHNIPLTLNEPKSAAMSFFSKRLMNEFETAMVNEPSVFKLLKGYSRWKGNDSGVEPT